MPKKIKNRQIQFSYDKTVDLHGYILEDAISELEKTIYSGRYSSILIIHGRGNGVLKNGLRKYLKENNYIRKIYPGESLNLPGSDGITVIYIK